MTHNTIKLSTIILISFIVIFAVNSITIQKMKIKDKFDIHHESKSSEAPIPINGCIYFYDECNYQGNLIIKLCHWKYTSIPKLIGEATNQQMKNIKSIAFSAHTKLYMDYDINRIPQKKITLENNVPCISELFKDSQDYKITILEANYLGI